MIHLYDKGYRGGTRVDVVFKDALGLACLTKQVVRVHFNGSIVPVRCGDTLPALKRKYHRPQSRQDAAQRRQWRTERNRDERQERRKAKSIARELPSYLRDWALSDQRREGYGKRMSLILARDAWQIAQTFKTPDAIAEAYNNGSITTLLPGHSGNSEVLACHVAVMYLGETAK